MVDLKSDFGHDENKPVRSDIPWIELFMDLVFIAALIQAGDRLLHNLGVAGLAEFTIFFALLWWAWSGITIHFARRNKDDVRARLLVFLFIFAIGNLGVMAARGLVGDSPGSVLFYALARLSLALLYADLAYRDPATRPLALRYAVGFGAGALIWALSALVEEPWRYAVWALALGADLLTGVLQDKEKLKSYLSLDAGRLSERYGQLTLIVIGESFIKVLDALGGEGKGVTEQSAVFTFLALVFIVSVFWAYYGDIAGTTIRAGRARLWTYLHLPLMMSIATLGVALYPIVTKNWHEPLDAVHHHFLHLTAAATFFWLAMIDLFARTSQASGGYGAGFARLASVGLLGLSWMSGAGLSAIYAITLAALACALPVLFEAARRPFIDTGVRASVEHENGSKPRTA